MKPNIGGRPANDIIRVIIIILFLLVFWVNIKRWSPTEFLIIFNKGIEIKM